MGRVVLSHGPKRFHHNAIGTITLGYETLHSPEEARLRELVGGVWLSRRADVVSGRIE
jgi:hypothetical protein